MKPTIKRSTYSHFYHASGFSLMVPKTKSSTPSNILTFGIADEEFTSVLISRKEASYTLKKFKKVLDRSRKIA